MDFQEMLEVVGSFKSYKTHKKMAGVSTPQLVRIQKDFGHALPDELLVYIRDFAPKELLHFYAYGNDIKIYGEKELGKIQDWYNFNSVENKTVEGWADHWFLIGDQGMDPFIYDLKNGGIHHAYHDEPHWKFKKIADNIPQFLTCILVFDYVINRFTYDEITYEDDDDQVFMKQEAADIAFPIIRKYASKYYNFWCDDYENSRQY